MSHAELEGGEPSTAAARTAPGAGWRSRHRARHWLIWSAVLVAALVTVVAAAGSAGDDQLALSEAVLLGAIEGLTEYLPVSSTAHLALTSDALGLTTTAAGTEAADAYAIVIQFGAIVAVAGLYRHRVESLWRGVVAADSDGRRLAASLAVAFAPAAVAGLLFGDIVKDELFSIWPIVAAWVVGGLVLLSPWVTSSSGTRSLEMLTVRSAAMIGAVQVLALWPGTSRSLVTILAGLAVGLSLVAAVEFSFLLGLVTLSAATVYEGLTGGTAILDAFGWSAATAGIVVAAITAWASVRWMIAYLHHRPLRIFGWYRLAVAAVAAVVAAGTGVL